MGLTSATVRMDGTAYGYTGGFRFLNIQIPNGAVILSATMEFYVVGVETPFSTTAFKAYGEAADNSAVFTLGSLPKDRVKTTALVDNSFNVSVGLPKWVTLNILPCVQEIVNRVGWVLGNALAIICHSTFPAWWLDVRSWDGDPAQAAILEVTWAYP